MSSEARTATGSLGPTKRPLTLQQRQAWETFKGVMGQDGYLLEYPSVAEIADAVVDLIVGAAEC